ncbi:hypothetical protein CSPX01_09884 [Colletotrichum filicis]|nr:hypothetical protein CSPX01_09884 [Colletotrichum filicis]
MASPALNSRRPPSGYSTNVVIRANHIDSTTPVRSRGKGPFPRRDDDDDDDDGYDNDGTSQRDPWTLLHQIQTWTG